MDGKTSSGGTFSPKVLANLAIFLRLARIGGVIAKVGVCGEGMERDRVRVVGVVGERIS
jgi:hypothetical protein